MKKVSLLFVLLFALQIKAQQLTEICPSNTLVWEGNEGYSDWVEIYNNTNEELNLEGYHLTNDLNQPEKWTFPYYLIYEGDYAVIPAVSNTTNDWAISFPFEKEGTALFLIAPSGEVIDELTQPQLSPNHSYGRVGNKWYFFDQPTPKQANDLSIGYKGYSSVPTINRISGKYLEGTNIVIRSAVSNEAVYYSTNGTNPVEANLYEQPIVLSRTINLKVVAKGDSLIASKALDRTYFIDVEHNLPVVNLTIDSLEMFDEINGIYMLGLGGSEEVPSANANYWGDHEIKAYYEYFDKDLKLVEALDCNLKIFGNWSRVHPMKSLQLRAQNAYDKSIFNQFYFKEKNINRFKRLVLRNSGGDYCNTCLKDGVLHKYFIEEDLNVDLQGFHPVVVYINGIYFGIENMREKIDRFYFESNYDVNPDSVNLLGSPPITVINGKAEDFLTLHTYATEKDLSDKTNYDIVASQLDINSLVDYFIIQLYLNNRDWPGNNLKVWNAPNQPKWRYACYDLDGAFIYFGYAQYEIQSLGFILNEFTFENHHVAIFKSLLNQIEFKRYFINRYADLLNTTFNADKMFEFILAEKKNIAKEMVEHYIKWCGNIYQWNERFKGSKTFLDTRADIVYEDLNNVFGFEKPVDISCNIYPEYSGIITLNTLKLETFPFSGLYYKEVPVTLVAKPYTNKTFLYWENSRTGKQIYTDSITVTPQEQDNYIAHFKSDRISINMELYPNPAVTKTNLKFSLPGISDVHLLVYKRDGGVALDLGVWNNLSAGVHKIEIDLSMLSGGHYLFTINTEYGMRSIPLFKKG